MKYNKLKLIILILPMILVFSGCNKQLGLSVDEGIEMGEKTTEIDIDTSDWLIYHNDEMGIEFKYPGKWLLENKNKDIYLVSEKRKKALNKNLQIRLFDIRISYYFSLEEFMYEYGENGLYDFNDYLDEMGFVRQGKIMFGEDIGFAGYFVDAISDQEFIFVKREKGGVLVIEKDNTGLIDNDGRITEKIVSTIEFVK